MPYNVSRIRSRRADHTIRTPNYGVQQTGTRRHNYTATTNVGNPAAMLPGEYYCHLLANFDRTFSVTIEDSPPVPTASNNYQSPTVFNGSRIENFHATVFIKNNGAVPVNLDVYETALSYYDAFIWNSFIPGSCPVTFDSTLLVPDNRGLVAYKAMTSTLISENQIKNFKFLQHYIQEKGTIQLGAAGASDSQVQIDINEVPAKCRRSQTGMFWSLYFHNNSDKNAGATLNLTSTINVGFEEIPADLRLPFIE